MPNKEIKELRHTGILEDSLSMATEEYNVKADNIWINRNLSWVYYDQLKVSSIPDAVEGLLTD